MDPTSFKPYVSTHLTPVEDLGMKLLCSTFATITQKFAVAHMISTQYLVKWVQNQRWA